MSDLIQFSFSELFEHEKLDEHCKPYKTYSTFFNIDGYYDRSGNVKECWITIKMFAQRLVYFSLEDWFRISISVKLESISGIEKMVESLKRIRELPSNNSEITIDLPILEGHYSGTIYYGYLAQNSSEDIKKDFDYLNIGISGNDITIYPISKDGIVSLKNMWVFPAIFYSTKDTHYCERLKDDTDNYNKLLSFLDRAIRWLELARNPRVLQVDLNQFTHLSNYEYGEEVLKHLQDALKCVEHNLLHPALNSFMHAIEWALIVGLKAKGKDIIDEEHKGKKLCYLKDLIIEAHKFGLISDKMKDRLDDFNKKYRRWTAHHKTGKIIEDDVKSVINIFEVLIAEIEKNI